MEHGEEREEAHRVLPSQPLLWALELSPPGVWSRVEKLRDFPTRQGNGVLSQACSSPSAGTYCMRGNVGPGGQKKSSFREASMRVVEQQTVPQSGKGRRGTSTELSRC